MYYRRKYECGQNNKPPIASNGNDTTYKNGKIGDGFWHCFTNINIYLVIVILELRPWFEMDGNLDLEYLVSGT